MQTTSAAPQATTNPQHPTTSATEQRLVDTLLTIERMCVGTPIGRTASATLATILNQQPQPAEVLKPTWVGVNLATTDATTPPAPGQPWPAQGGTYIGIAPAEGNLPARHLVALDIVPDTDDGELTWSDAVKWAESHGNGARLPTQLEALFAFTTAKPAFKPVYHWTLTQTSSISAIVQVFEYGYSYWTSKGHEFRVRPFRGLALQTFTPLTDAPTHCNRGGA